MKILKLNTLPIFNIYFRSRRNRRCTVSIDTEGRNLFEENKGIFNREKGKSN